jgi:hypothetical protein
VIPFLFKGGILGGLGKGNCFGGGWGLSQGVVSWVAWQKKVCLFFKVGRLGVFFCFSRNSFFGDVGWLEKRGGYIYIYIYIYI